MPRDNHRASSDRPGSSAYHGVSLERGDGQKRKLLPSPIPVITKFLKVNAAPAVDQIVSSARQISFVNRSGLDLNQRFELAVDRMEVNRRMIAVVESNDDAVKPTDLRHGQFA